MMNKLSIKYKLIIAFVFFFTMLIINILVNRENIVKTQNGFNNYREVARSSVILGSVKSEILLLKVSVKEYLISHSDKDIANFNNYYLHLQNSLEKADTLTKYNSKINKNVNDIKNELENYKKLFFEVVEYMKKRDDIVFNNLDKNGKIVEEIFTSLMLKMENKNKEKALIIAKNIRTLLLARLYTSKFLLNNSLDDMNRVNTEFDDLHSELNQLEKYKKDIKILEKLAQSKELIMKYKEGVSEIRDTILKRNQIINSNLVIIGGKIEKNIEESETFLVELQDEIGPKIKAFNENIVLISISVTILIIVLVLLFFYFFFTDIMGSLKKLEKGLVNFFAYLNGETKRFSIIKIDSNDEIGQMSNLINESIKITKRMSDEKNSFT